MRRDRLRALSRILPDHRVHRLEVKPREVIDRGRALRRYRDVQRPQPSLERPREMRERRVIARRDDVHVRVEEHLHEREGHRERERYRHPERVFQRVVAVEIEHAKVDVIARERAHEHRGREPYALIPPRVRLRALHRRRRERASAVRDDELAHLAEEKDPVHAGRLERQPLRLRRRDLRVVRVRLHRVQQQPDVPRIHPVEQEAVRPPAVRRGRDPAQISEQTDERVLHGVGSKRVDVAPRRVGQLFAQRAERRHKLRELRGVVLHEQQSRERGVEDGSVARVGVLRQEREVVRRVIRERRVYGVQTQQELPGHEPDGEVLKQVQRRLDHLVHLREALQVLRDLRHGQVHDHEVVVQPHAFGQLDVHLAAVHRLLANVHLAEISEKLKHAKREVAVQALLRLRAAARQSSAHDRADDVHEPREPSLDDAQRARVRPCRHVRSHVKLRDRRVDQRREELNRRLVPEPAQVRQRLELILKRLLVVERVLLRGSRRHRRHRVDSRRDERLRYARHVRVEHRRRLALEVRHRRYQSAPQNEKVIHRRRRPLPRLQRRQRELGDVLDPGLVPVHGDELAELIVRLQPR
eukprot:30952-Pelagococcus_subviridis.AAC.12